MRTLADGLDVRPPKEEEFDGSAIARRGVQFPGFVAWLLETQLRRDGKNLPRPMAYRGKAI